MRIGIDARLLTYRRGIGNFVYNLLAALAELPNAYSLVLYVDDPRAVGLVPTGSRFTVKVLAPRLYPLWEQFSLPLAAARDQLHILHCPANTAPLRLPQQIRLVLTIHDVMYLLPVSVLSESPSLYQRLGQLYRRLVVPRVAPLARAIITDSVYSRQDIIKYLPVPAESVRVIWGAPSHACRVITDTAILANIRAKYGLNSRFILALAALDPRKNTARIIEAYARFRRQATGRYQLALVGLTPAGRARFRQLAETLGVADEVIAAGFVPEEDLVALYNAAELLAYPSLYEGFGLPVLEAMACGTPVVTSPSGSLPEVAGEAAVMVDPLNIEAIADAFWRVVNETDLRQELIVKGLAQTQKFSWQQAAVQTLEVYRNVMA